MIKENNKLGKTYIKKNYFTKIIFLVYVKHFENIYIITIEY